MSASIVRSVHAAQPAFSQTSTSAQQLLAARKSAQQSARQCTAVTGNAHMPRRRTTCGTTSDGRRRANAQRPRPATSHRCCAVDPWWSERTTATPRPAQGPCRSAGPVNNLANNLAKPVGGISQLGQDALAQTTAAGAGVMRLSPVRNDIAGILRRMQPRCERERGSLPRRTSPGCQ